MYSRLLPCIAGLLLISFICSSYGPVPENTEPRTTLLTGSKAPNIILKKNKGWGKHKLKKANKKKIVLIEFWASWCAPCRLQNRKLAEVYENYKNRTYGNANGFEVFAVSFDKKKKDWKKAIKKDGIENFKYHASDLKGWDSVYALIYELNAIPANVLIDEEGTILATDISAYDLEGWLQSIEGR